jgi:hypothetical protein
MDKEACYRLTRLVTRLLVPVQLVRAMDVASGEDAVASAVVGYFAAAEAVGYGGAAAGAHDVRGGWSRMGRLAARSEKVLKVVANGKSG